MSPVISLRNSEFCKDKDCFRELFLFSNGYKFRNITIVSAYIDYDSILKLLDLIEENSDKRSKPTLKIYTDRSSIRNLKQHEEELTKKIRNICSVDEDIPIYLVSNGTLFHSKIYLIEGNNSYAKLVFGSMNFTQNGFNSNEELVIAEEFYLDNKSKSKKYPEYFGREVVSWIKDEYIPKLESEGNSKLLFDSGHTAIKSNTLRDILLDGNIYYEVDETKSFHFNLQLPDSMKKGNSIDPLLEATIADKISLIKLILDKQIGIDTSNLNDLLSEQTRQRNNYKNYCVQTCYGFWSPSILEEEINNELEKTKNNQLLTIIDFIKDNQNHNKIERSFINFHKRVVSNQEDDSEIKHWRYYDIQTAKKAWGDWFSKLLEKLHNEEYIDRLKKSILSAPVPDVWGDQLSADIFEHSFLENMLYMMDGNKPHNKLIKYFKDNTDIKYSDDEDNLKGLIKKWLENNSASMFSGYNSSHEDDESE